jgi:hypothetical protein
LKKHKTGALSRQLGIPIKDNIPKQLLVDIIRAKNGNVIYHSGKRVN